MKLHNSSAAEYLNHVINHWRVRGFANVPLTITTSNHAHSDPIPANDIDHEEFSHPPSATAASHNDEMDYVDNHENTSVSCASADGSDAQIPVEGNDNHNHDSDDDHNSCVGNETDGLDNDNHDDRNENGDEDEDDVVRYSQIITVFFWSHSRLTPEL